MVFIYWATDVLQWGVQYGTELRNSEYQNLPFSSDYFLKFESMKQESQVIAYEIGAVNRFLGLVHTARHTPEVG